MTSVRARNPQRLVPVDKVVYPSAMYRYTGPVFAIGLAGVLLFAVGYWFAQFMGWV